MSQSRETTFSATRTELISALQDLITEHKYKDCLRFIKMNDQKDVMIIYSKKTTDEKYKLRDAFFRDLLKLDFQNVSGEYHFLVTVEAALANTLVQDEIKANRAKILSSTQNADGSQEFNDKRKSLIKVAAVLNLFFPLPENFSWSIYKDGILAWGLGVNCSHDKDFDLRKIILNDDIATSELGVSVGFDAELAKKIQSSLESYVAKWGVCYYQLTNSIELLAPVLNNIAEAENILNKKLKLECHSVNWSEGFSKSLYAHVSTHNLDALLKEYLKYQALVEKEAARYLEKNSALKITLEYLFFHPKVNQPLIQEEKQHATTLGPKLG